MPYAVELSARRGVGGCVWPSLVCVAELGECDSERGSTLGVVKARYNLGFCCGGDHVFDDGGDVEDGSVKCFLFGGFVS
jgi:hypothetical protein